MDLVSEIFLFLVSVWGILVSIAAVAGFAFVLYLESKPNVRFESKTGYIDYPAGLQIETYDVSVDLGRVPRLNRHSFRKLRLPPLNIVNLPSAQFDLVVETSVRDQRVGSDMWNLDYRKCCPCVKRRAVPKDVDNFKVHLTLTQERATPQIRSLVTVDPKVQKNGNVMNVILKLMNSSKFMIKDYEVLHSLPSIEKLKLISATKVDVRSQSITLNTKDFGITYEVPLESGESLASLPTRVHPIFLDGTLDLEPGQTILEFEYTPRQTTLEHQSET